MGKFKFFRKSKEIKQGKTRSDLIKELGYDQSHGYSMLKSSRTLPEGQFYLELAKTFDEHGYMSEKLGNELDYLLEDDNYVIGIHRTGYNHIDQNTLSDIFNRGLINNGDMMGGGNAGQTSIEKTVSFYDDIATLSSQLKQASGYKCSEGCIIVKIPKEALAKKEGAPIPIYYNQDGINRLLPEFIYGYVPVNKDGVLGEIVHNPVYNDNHMLPNNLDYDSSVTGKAKRALKNSYSETYLKYGKYQADQALIRFIKNKDISCFTGENNRKILLDYMNVYESLKNITHDITNEDIANIINSFETWMSYQPVNALDNSVKAAKK